MLEIETNLALPPSRETDRSMLIQYGIAGLGTSLLVPPFLQWPVVDHGLPQVCAFGGGVIVVLASIAKIRLCAWQLWAQVLLGIGIASVGLFVGSHSIWYEEGLPIVVGLATAFLAGAHADHLQQAMQLMRLRGPRLSPATAGRPRLVHASRDRDHRISECAAFQRPKLALIKSHRDCHAKRGNQNPRHHQFHR